MTKPTTTPDTYADLLKARGDVPITVLRQLHEQIGALLEFVTTTDKVFELPPPPSDAEKAIANALRARYPDFADKTDREVLDYFIRNPKDSGDDSGK